MKLKAVTIKNFKRFTELTVQGLPESARLIVLVGPNGCGKSSFFDALCIGHDRLSRRRITWEPEYHRKASAPSQAYHSNEIQLEFYNPLSEEELKKSFYFRSAYRNDPEFQIRTLERLRNHLDENRVSRMIDNDATVARNYQRLVSQALEDVFEPEDGSLTLNKFKELIIGDIRDAFKELFPDVDLNSLGKPLEDGTFRFTKGKSEGFSFKNLSGGEKAAFDLILDLVVARRAYDNTVFCIDEPESHMNAKLQANLLYVLYGLIPENCQLMLATHSIGMIRQARDIGEKDIDSVAFLDFGDRNFDLPQVIKPAVPDRVFWQNALYVALDGLAALVAPGRVVICEGEPLTGQPVRNHSLDADCYNQIFERQFPDTRFVSMGSDHQIVGDQRGLAEALGLLISGPKIVRLIDRDDRTDRQANDLAAKGVRVLSRRNLESYLFDNEVLQALAVWAGKEDKIEELLAERQCICDAKPDVRDDLKPVRRELYDACKKILGLTQRGNDTNAFMRDTLAPLIKPGMRIYDELKHDIFDSKSGT